MRLMNITLSETLREFDVLSVIMTIIRFINRKLSTLLLNCHFRQNKSHI